MSTPTQTPAELAAAEIVKMLTETHFIDDDFRRMAVEIKIQAVIDAEKKALTDSICEGLDLETLAILCASERDSLSGINILGGAKLYSQLHTLVSRAKRAKEGKGV